MNGTSLGTNLSPGALGVEEDGRGAGVAAFADIGAGDADALAAAAGAGEGATGDAAAVPSGGALSRAGSSSLVK